VLLATIVSVDPFGHRPRPGTGGAFLVLVAFLISFLAIRTSARLTRSVSWWPGGVKSGDVHIHHLVWGICLMMFSGFLAFAMPLEAPWWHVFAIGFGVGVGFTLDEFALWVRLKDVYWSEEGRASLDAVVVAAAFAALVVLGWRYGDKRLDEARTRFDPARRTGRWQRRIGDLVAGAPTPEPSTVTAPLPAADDDS
jgi:hypothetical protein